MKSGHKTDAAAFKSSGQDVDIAYLANTAYGAMNADYANKGAEDYIIERVNGMKDEYGTGASTLITFYNALGMNLKLHDHRNIHGSFFKYQPDNDVYNGEWSCLLHVHPSGSALGSHGLLCYSLVDSNTAYHEDIVLVLAWSNNYTGSNQCACAFTNRQNYDSNAAQAHAQMMYGQGDNGHRDYGVLGVKYSIGQDTSPVFRAVASLDANF